MAYNNSDSFRNTLKYQGPDYAYVPLYYRSRDPNSPTDASNDIRPKEQQGYYLIGSIWMNTANGNCWRINQIYSLNGVTVANWELQSSNTGTVTTLSDNSTPPGSAYVDPLDGNIQFTGEVVNQFNFFPTVVSNPTNHSIAINPMSPARWIVDPLGTNGTHTTIQSAINSASSGDTILLLPGTYNESISINKSLNIAAFNDDQNASVSLTGSITSSSAVFAVFSGLRIVSSVSPVISITGGNGCKLIFIRCTLIFFGGGLGINIPNSITNAKVSMHYCLGDISDPNTQFFTVGTGTTANILFNCCFITNSLLNGNTNTGTNTIGSGLLQVINSSLPFQITTSGTNSMISNASDFSYLISTSLTIGNQLNLTVGGSGTNTISNCVFSSGSQACISVGSALTISSSTLNASTAPLIGGGTINFGGLVFVNNSTNSVTTKNQLTVT